MKTMKEFLENALIESEVNEAVKYSLNRIAMLFTQYLLGEKDGAINALRKTESPIEGLAAMGSSNYNKLFTKMHKDIFNAISKNNPNKM